MKYYGCTKCVAIHHEWEPTYPHHLQYKTRSGVQDSPLPKGAADELLSMALVEEKFSGFRWLIERVVIDWRRYTEAVEKEVGLEYWAYFISEDNMVRDFILWLAEDLKYADRNHQTALIIPPEFEDEEEDDVPQTNAKDA